MIGKRDIHSGEYETLQRFLLDNINPEVVEPDVTVGIQDPSTRAQVSANQHILSASRARLAQRKEELRQVVDVEKNGFQAEKHSALITTRVEMVPLVCIVDDPSFSNLRLSVIEEQTEQLTESIKSEGLKIPITLVAANPEATLFYVRAGFRRFSAIRSLRWERIPAIVLPYNTPVEDGYWTNILENTARSQLHSYEIANAARTMRERFHVPARIFARRAGLSEGHVNNLLRCIDHLPEEVLAAWKERRKIPVSYLIAWSTLEHSEAIKAMRRYAGLYPAIVGGWSPSPGKQKKAAIQMATGQGLKRMQQMRFAIEVTKTLDPKHRDICLKIVDFCSGSRDDVPGIYKIGDKQRLYQSRRREDLVMPEVGDLPPAAPEDETKDN